MFTRSSSRRFGDRLTNEIKRRRLMSYIDEVCEGVTGVKQEHVKPLSSRGHHPYIFELDILVGKISGQGEKVNWIIKALQEDPKAPLTTRYDVQARMAKEIKISAFFMDSVMRFENCITTLTTTYEDLFPKFSSFVPRDKQGHNKSDQFAVIIYENLTKLGYKIEDKFFDMSTVNIAVRNLAYLHAVPIAMRLKNNGKFTEEILHLLNEIPDGTEIKDHYKLIFDNMCSILDSLPELEQHRDKIETWIQLSQRFSWTVKLYDSLDWFTVCHPRYSIRNIMVLRDKTRKAISTKLLEIHRLEFNSNVKDLIYFIFTSVKAEILESKIHFDSILQTYYEHFISALTSHQVELKHIEMYSFESFMKEFNSMGPFMLANILYTLSSIVSDKFDENGQPILGEACRVRLRKIIQVFLNRQWIRDLVVNQSPSGQSASGYNVSPTQTPSTSATTTSSSPTELPLSGTRKNRKKSTPSTTSSLPFTTPFRATSISSKPPSTGAQFSSALSRVAISSAPPSSTLPTKITPLVPSAAKRIPSKKSPASALPKSLPPPKTLALRSSAETLSKQPTKTSSSKPTSPLPKKISYSTPWNPSLHNPPINREFHRTRTPSATTSNISSGERRSAKPIERGPPKALTSGLLLAECAETFPRKETSPGESTSSVSPRNIGRQRTPSPHSRTEPARTSPRRPRQLPSILTTFSGAGLAATQTVCRTSASSKPPGRRTLPKTPSPPSSAKRAPIFSTLVRDHKQTSRQAPAPSISPARRMLPRTPSLTKSAQFWMLAQTKKTSPRASASSAPRVRRTLPKTPSPPLSARTTTSPRGSGSSAPSTGQRISYSPSSSAASTMETLPPASTSSAPATRDMSPHVPTPSTPSTTQTSSSASSSSAQFIWQTSPPASASSETSAKDTPPSPPSGAPLTSDMSPRVSTLSPPSTMQSCQRASSSSAPTTWQRYPRTSASSAPSTRETSPPSSSSSAPRISEMSPRVSALSAPSTAQTSPRGSISSAPSAWQRSLRASASSTLSTRETSPPASSSTALPMSEISSRVSSISSPSNSNEPSTEQTHPRATASNAPSTSETSAPASTSSAPYTSDMSPRVSTLSPPSTMQSSHRALSSSAPSTRQTSPRAARLSVQFEGLTIRRRSSPSFSPESRHRGRASKSPTPPSSNS